jgi:spermidine synthase
VLDRVGPGAEVDVLELFEQVVSWNRGPLAAHANRPLEDRRVHLRTTDVGRFLAASENSYNAILMDIDNGPEAFTVNSNNRLYAAAGLALLYRSLAFDGILVLWSAFRSPRFERRLREAGFVARSVTARARPSVGKGARHTLFVAKRAGA